MCTDEDFIKKISERRDTTLSDLNSAHTATASPLNTLTQTSNTASSLRQCKGISAHTFSKDSESKPL